MSSTATARRRGSTSSYGSTRSTTSIPSISTTGPAADWHEREVEDLFGLTFRRAPAAGRIRPARGLAGGRQPDAPELRRPAAARSIREPKPMWEPPTIVAAPGAFAMPIGPVFSDFAEVGAFPARDRRRGRDPHDPAVLLQISRRREDRRGPARSTARCCSPSGSRAPPPSPTAWPSARPSKRSAGSRCRRERGRCGRCSPNWSGCAITRRRSPASATRRRWRSRPARPR